MPDADTACRCGDRCPLLKPLLASIWPKETWLIFSLAQRIFPCLHLPEASQYRKVTALNQISVCSSAGWKCDNEVEFYPITALLRFPWGGVDKDEAGMLLPLSCSKKRKSPARHLWFIKNLLRYQHLILAYLNDLSWAVSAVHVAKATFRSHGWKKNQLSHNISKCVTGASDFKIVLILKRKHCPFCLSLATVNGCYTVVNLALGGLVIWRETNLLGFTFTYETPKVERSDEPVRNWLKRMWMCHLAGGREKRGGEKLSSRCQQRLVNNC